MANSSQYGTFIQTTFDLDVQQLQQIDVRSPEFKELLVRLYQNLNNVVNALNIKDTGIYNNSYSIVCGQKYFPNPANNSGTSANASLRDVNRQTYISTGTSPIAHGITITANTLFTRIYGVANDNVGNNYYPLPWASAAGATNMELKVNATNIVITNNSGISFTNYTVILEWLTN